MTLRDHHHRAAILRENHFNQSFEISGFVSLVAQDRIPILLSNSANAHFMPIISHFQRIVQVHKPVQSLAVIKKSKELGVGDGVLLHLWEQTAPTLKRDH